MTFAAHAARGEGKEAMFRVAEKSDAAQLTGLFSAVFGDPEPVAANIFEKFAGYENVFLAEEEGRVIASLCAVPVTLQGRKGAYYYGVCTRPERRADVGIGPYGRGGV